MRVALAAVAVALAACGCGRSSDATSLRLEATNPTIGTARFSLRCDPPGGTIPRPARACARLLADPGALLHPKPFTCAGGTFSWWDVRITGRFRGDDVARSFSTCWTPQMHLIARLGIGFTALTDNARGIPPDTAPWLKRIARFQIEHLSAMRPARASFTTGKVTRVFIHGRLLVCGLCSHPAGAPNPRGTEAIVTIEPGTHDVSDFSLHR